MERIAIEKLNNKNNKLHHEAAKSRIIFNRERLAGIDLKLYRRKDSNKGVSSLVNIRKQD